MYIISLVFFGFAVRKYKDKYIPAAFTMMLWFLACAMLERPTALLLPYLDVLAVAEKVVFAILIVLLLTLCVLRKHPLRFDWIPLVGTVLAAGVRVCWYGYSHYVLDHMGADSVAAINQLAQVQSWKNFSLQGILCAVAVWHIYWMSKPRFIK